MEAIPLFGPTHHPHERRPPPATKQIKTKPTGGTGDTGDNSENKGLVASPVKKSTPGILGTGFFINTKGLWYKADESEDPLWICSRLEIPAMTRNQDSEAWGRLLEFTDPDGRKHLWACPLELLAGDGSEFRRTLLSMGLQISPNTKARNLLANHVQTCKVTARATCTDKTGWHGNTFVLPDETIGQADGERVLLQTLGEPTQMRQTGTAVGWRDNVGLLCAGNSRLVLAASTAFAAPLLNLIGDESGGLHFTGNSSTGKTTALRVGASIWGGPEYLHRWRATSNGLEAIAQAHNDGLLVLDELAQIDPREAGECSYMIANGTGKHRSRRDGLARKAATWRLLFLSAGEIGLADHMREAGKRARAGQEARLADIPADAGKGLGLFEELHGFSSGGEFADRLNHLTTQYHGTAARAFLHSLVQAPVTELKQGIEALREDFLRTKVPPEADGQARRVASRFALIAAGGEIATKFGLTGWKEGEAIDSAAICFEAWLGRRGGSGSQEEAAALAQVQHFLEAHGEARFTDLDNPTDRPTINRAGYRRRTDSGLEYLFSPEVFRREVCVGLDYRHVAKILKDRGLLKTESPDRLTIKPRDIGRVYCIKEGRDEN